jgi:integrase
VDKIRTVPGRLWHKEEKVWTVPHDSQAVARLIKLFAGERVLLAAPLSPGPAPKPGFEVTPLLDKVRAAVRVLHLSRGTERAYVGWAKRFLSRQAGARPEDLAEAEVARFLLGLASGGVSASTQNQALNALLFLFQRVLGKKIGMLKGVVRAKRPRQLPVVLTRAEVRAVLERMEGTPRLMDVVRRQHETDLAEGLGSVALPDALARQNPAASKDWGWQWVFPATSHYVDRETGQQRRHHLHETVLQRAFKEARLKSGITKDASCHSLRHSCHPYA